MPDAEVVGLRLKPWVLYLGFFHGEVTENITYIFFSVHYITVHHRLHYMLYISKLRGQPGTAPAHQAMVSGVCRRLTVGFSSKLYFIYLSKKLLYTSLYLSIKNYKFI
jgi:hypothetical protein